MTDGPGLLAGRYRLTTLLSRGGMGEVWQAADETLGRPVAVKLLATALSEPGDRERFLREARSAAQLSHPNVVAMYDVGEWNRRPFLVMELLDGPTLAVELAERGPLPVEEVRHLGAQAAAGLQAAHLSGVVHRDIKPSNLSRSRDGTLKLMDFGIARALDDAATRLTRPGTVLGTARYLAPEQAGGRAADARSDLYALGCVLYEMLAGRPPFTGGMTSVVYSHVHVEPEPLSRFRPDVPPDLDGLVRQLLAKLPEHRPAGAGAVRATLLSQNSDAGKAAEAAPTEFVGPVVPFAEAEPFGADSTSSLPLEAFDQPARRSRLSRTALLVAVGLLVAGIAGAVLAWATTGAGGTTPSANAGSDNASTSPSPSRTPTPTPASTSPGDIGPAAFGTRVWLRQLAAGIAVLERRGQIDPSVADKAHKRIDEALEKYRDGKPDEALDKAYALSEELAEAQDEGRIRADGRMATLLASLPVESDGGAGDGDDGDGDRHGGRGRG